MSYYCFRPFTEAELPLIARWLKTPEGSPAVAIDPDAKNERARRAYARAGFEGDEVVNAAEGPVVVMVFRDLGHNPAVNIEKRRRTPR